MAGSKVFGDVTITPSDAGGVLPDIEEVVQIELSDEVFLNLFFDGKREISEVSFHNDDRSLVGVRRSRENNSWREFSYGAFEKGYETYGDLDFDGSFDVRCAISEDYVVTKYIYFDRSWIKVDKNNYEKASIKEGQGKSDYLFTDGVGWQKADEKK